MLIDTFWLMSAQPDDPQPLVCEVLSSKTHLSVLPLFSVPFPFLNWSLGVLHSVHICVHLRSETPPAAEACHSLSFLETKNDQSHNSD